MFCGPIDHEGIPWSNRGNSIHDLTTYKYCFHFYCSTIDFLTKAIEPSKCLYLNNTKKIALQMETPFPQSIQVF